MTLEMAAEDSPACARPGFYWAIALLKLILSPKPKDISSV